MSSSAVSHRNGERLKEVGDLDPPVALIGYLVVQTRPPGEIAPVGFAVEGLDKVSLVLDLSRRVRAKPLSTRSPAWRRKAPVTASNPISGWYWTPQTVPPSYRISAAWTTVDRLSASRVAPSGRVSTSSVWMLCASYEPGRPFRSGCERPSRRRR